MSVRMEVGEERISQNGYVYVKQEDGKWILKHHLIAAKKLGREIYSHERVSFEDKDRTNFDPDNIVVKPKGIGSINKRLAVVEDRIRELEAERDILLEQRGTK